MHPRLSCFYGVLSTKLGCDGGHGPVGLLYGQQTESILILRYLWRVVLSTTWITEMILHLIQWTKCGPGRALTAYQGSLNPRPAMKRQRRSCSRSSTLHSFTQPRLCCLYNSDGITFLMMDSRDRRTDTHTQCSSTGTILHDGLYTQAPPHPQQCPATGPTHAVPE